MNFMKILSMVVALVPLVTQAVAQAENLIGSAPGQGAAKLQFVKEIVLGVFDAAGDSKEFAAVWPVLAKVAAAAVAMANAVGVFSKADKPEKPA